MRKVFADNLPRWTKGKNKGGINWEKSKGEKVYFVYNNIEGWITIIDVLNKDIIVDYKGNKFKTDKHNFLKGALGKIIGVVTNEFKIEIGTTFKNCKRDLTIIDRKYKKDGSGNNRKYYKYICNKCGYKCGHHYKNGKLKEEYWVLEDSILKGSGCVCCCKSPQITVCGINSIVDTTPWMVQYFQGGYDEAKKIHKK